ncbi:ribose transport system substrate-binding protein [Paracoccus pantotrophus]|nr:MULTISPECIES: ABC transporter substrate-binding protein [Paracoccus]MCJ1902533.1 ABC transporter substrate-binding protein [Paracoccus versutus]RKS42622.1 ribose transport system substrate-binding protein [Paracoccus pantotrophus]SFY44758.1 ribose transport system substrate-binding protein [Paracoccus pantotrophus]
MKKVTRQTMLAGVLAPFVATAQGGAMAQVANVDIDKEHAAQVALMSATPNGPADKPWEQWFDAELADTSAHAKPGPYRVCFSNASVSNAWRVTGWTTMKAEVDLHPNEIASFDYADAQGNDDKQISDIRSFLNSGSCDVLIVSPNTSAALTPVVEEACKQLPVITFDRSVNTSCPVTAVRSIGGYAWGKAAADYVVANVPKGGNVLVLRTAPGLDIFETRWAAAEKVFAEADVKVIGNEFVGGDRAKAKATVVDYLSRTGHIDAVWVDLGVVSVAVAEAFQDMGLPYPVITGEDEQDYLQAWKDDGFKGIAPTYPAFQWRTAVQAALKVLKGEPVPAPEWILPQPVITEAERDAFIDPQLPPLHFATCGCESMPGYPQRWGAND